MNNYKGYHFKSTAAIITNKPVHFLTGLWNRVIFILQWPT